MAFGKKKKQETKGEKGEKGENRYVTLFQILEGKAREGEDEAKPYAKANNFKGRLLWQAFGGKDGDDENDSTFYEIQKAFISDPHEKAPEFVLQTLVVNLNNPKAAVKIED